jgi:hypothetical protein
MNASLAALILFAAGAISACASPPPRFATGSEAILSPEGLRPLKDSGFDRGWARPGASFADYHAAWFRFPAEIAYQNPPKSNQPDLGGNNYPLSAGLASGWMASLRETFDAEFSGAGRWSPVGSAGSNVLEIRVFLIDLAMHAPLATLGGDDHQWIDTLGSVTVVIEVIDSRSGALLARLAERDRIASEAVRATRANERDATFEINRLFRQWAARLRLLLDAFESPDLLAT